MTGNFVVVCSLFFLCCFVWFLYKRRKIYVLSWKLPGPFALPIIGNALTFFCTNDELFENAVAVVSRYPSPMRFWLGPKFLIIFTEPEQASKILSSSNFSQKDEIYRFMKILNGEGLISGSGPKWKRDRKLMAPLFLKKNIEEYFSTICRHTNVLLEKLEAEVDKPNFNIGKYIHRCCADFVNESIVGIKTDAQNGKLDSFLRSAEQVYVILHARIVKVWLQIDWIFRLTHLYKEQERVVNDIHSFLRKVIRAKQEQRLHNHEFNGTLLDKILDIQSCVPNFATEDELVHHMSTLYTASEDPVTTIASFALLLFGLYPKIQQKVVDEIREKVGDKAELDLEDLFKLDYLEMCIRDVVRLFPIAAFIMRSTAEDFKIDQLTIPKGCSVCISIHSIHRSPKHWERPNEFYPEHFLPEAIQKRHPHAFLSFSAGPRGCLGKPYSYMALKILLASVVRKFIIEADGKIDDVQLQADISVRAKNWEYPVRVKRRKPNL